MKGWRPHWWKRRQDRRRNDLRKGFLDLYRYCYNSKYVSELEYPPEEYLKTGWKLADEYEPLARSLAN